VIKELIKLANELDKKGLSEEADRLDKIISKSALPRHDDYDDDKIEVTRKRSEKDKIFDDIADGFIKNVFSLSDLVKFIKELISKSFNKL
jgi:hypothetical protein